MRRLSLLLLLLLTSHALAQPTGVVVIELTNGSHVAVVVGGDGEVTVVPATMIRVTPPAPPNPYPEPTAVLKQAVEPLAAFALSRADATAMANVISQAADRAPAMRLNPLSQWIVEAGKPLGLRGKYDGFAPALDKVLEATIGTTDRDGTAADAAALRAIAWAIWEAGP